MVLLRVCPDCYEGDMKTRNFRDLQVWQRSMLLAKDVYRITAAFPRSEAFGLSGQMRRCAVSVPSNIAEGRRTDARGMQEGTAGRPRPEGPEFRGYFPVGLRSFPLVVVCLEGAGSVP